MMGVSGPGRAQWAAEGLLLRPWELRGIEMGRSGNVSHSSGVGKGLNRSVAG